MSLKMIARYLDELNALLEDVPQYAPNASPTTRALRNSIRLRLYRVIDQAQIHFSTPETLDGDPDGPPVYGPDVEDKPDISAGIKEDPSGQGDVASELSKHTEHHSCKSEPRSAATARRANAILETLQDDAVQSAQELVAAIFHGTGNSKLSYIQAENAALKRLLRAHETSNPTRWLGLLEPFFGGYPDLTLACSDSHDTDLTPDIKQRLQLRYKSIDALGKAQSGCHVLINILTQIEALKFAYDWRAHDGQIGAKSWKTRFLVTTFQDHSIYQPHFMDLDTEARRDKMQKFKPEFAKWKHAQQRAITARNRLIDLFETFGAAVLLDPTWKVAHLVVRVSPDFAAVMKLIYAHIPRLKAHLEDPTVPPSPLLAQQKAARDTVLQVVRVLATPAVRDHVAMFLDKYAPWGVDVAETLGCV
ncbi:hypothetical protein CERSUDRAFT_126425 [Gelatoporia subvermispora B]|uniref:Uncharacterized protein n=1 Tax=Ceriporiopsis subvermispora (strain B) TaxID=914234 RepID=M2R216_CERS8|nr:hypothetical protein CERSUDRAFT_126425 [Gelatoporia subvermispora B]